jgi:hypothetical protein
MPFLFFIYFKSCNRNIQTYIPLIALKLVLLNSALAIGERIFNFNLFPIRQTFGEQFRSTAFLGHPLNNALITVSFVLFVLMIDMKHLKKIVYLFVLVLALFCYGARGSLVVSIAAILLLYILPVLVSTKKYFYRTNKTLAISILSFFAISLGYLLLFTTFGERFRETSKDDAGSSQVRLDTLNLINIDNITNFFWPISVESTDKISERGGVEIVENFIIIWIFRFGLILTVILFYFLIKFLLINSQIESKYYSIIVILLFFAAAATNNSLGSNTNALLFFILLFSVENNKHKFLF